MNRLKRSALLTISLLLVASVGFSQQGEYVEVRDFESWWALGLEYKLKEKWSFGLEQHLRLDNNSSEIKGYFTQLETKYEVFNNFKFGVGLRYIKKNDNEGSVQGYENYFRYHLDASYKHKINRFSLKYRLRYQNRNELGVSVSEGDYPNQYVRFKTSLGYNIKGWKLDPKFSAEIFNHFEKGEDNGFNNLRLTLETDYKIKKVGKIRAFYRMEHELNVETPKTTNILGLAFTHTFKKK